MGAYSVDTGVRIRLKDTILESKTTDLGGMGFKTELRMRTLIDAQVVVLPIPTEALEQLAQHYDLHTPAIADVEICIFPKKEP